MEQGYEIHAMEIAEDHVHIFLEFHPSISLSRVVQYLKEAILIDCSDFILN
jgi:putative transposase